MSTMYCTGDTNWSAAATWESAPAEADAVGPPGVTDGADLNGHVPIADVDIEVDSIDDSSTGGGVSIPASATRIITAANGIVCRATLGFLRLPAAAACHVTVNADIADDGDAASLLKSSRIDHTVIIDGDLTTTNAASNGISATKGILTVNSINNSNGGTGVTVTGLNTPENFSLHVLGDITCTNNDGGDAITMASGTIEVDGDVIGTGCSGGFVGVNAHAGTVARWPQITIHGDVNLTSCPGCRSIANTGGHIVVEGGCTGDGASAYLFGMDDGVTVVEGITTVGADALLLNAIEAAGGVLILGAMAGEVVATATTLIVKTSIDADGYDDVIPAVENVEDGTEYLGGLLTGTLDVTSDNPPSVILEIG